MVFDPPPHRIAGMQQQLQPLDQPGLADTLGLVIDDRQRRAQPVRQIAGHGPGALQHGVVFGEKAVEILDQRGDFRRKVPGQLVSFAVAHLRNGAPDRIERPQPVADHQYPY